VTQAPTIRERPVIFTGDSVRAILEGRKVQTRRAITPQPAEALIRLDTYDLSDVPDWKERSVLNAIGGRWWRCPYGQPGDRLWVRETIRGKYLGDGRWEATYAADGQGVDLTCWHPEFGDKRPSWFRRSRPVAASIHMPRWASRITLEIEAIRVQPVQEISEEDAEAEGVALGRVVGLGRIGMESHREGFAELWDSINAKRGFSWASNPWVWKIVFRRIKP